MRTLGAALVVAVLGCSPKGGEAEAVRAAYLEYEKALVDGNLEGVKARLTAAKARELEAPEAAAGLGMASALRPKDFVIEDCVVGTDRASLKLRGSTEMGKVEGEVLFLKEGGRWKVDKEGWTVKVESAAPVAVPAGPPEDAPMPEAVKAIVDRVASADAAEGSKAWLELGARYQSSKAFLKEARQALGDDRPVAFAILEERFKGGGKEIRYFTSKPSAPGGAGSQPARTVGEALRYHFWQYEDASGSGFKGSFVDWWPSFARSIGL